MDWGWDTGRKMARRNKVINVKKSFGNCGLDERMKRKIACFHALEAYRRSYDAAITVIQQDTTKIPREEKFDLASQLGRSTKAIPRLIAEGYSKRNQVKGFQKYLDDALTESNETIVSLNQARDIYGIEKEICSDMIREYEITSQQIYKLALVWTSFGERKHKYD